MMPDFFWVENMPLLHIFCRSSQLKQMLSIYVNFGFSIMKKLLGLAHENLANILLIYYHTDLQSYHLEWLE